MSRRFAQAVAALCLVLTVDGMIGLNRGLAPGG